MAHRWIRHPVSPDVRLKYDDQKNHSRDEWVVAPFGWACVVGHGVHICRNYMQGEAVYVWLTRVAASVELEQKARTTSEDLGRSQGLHVYVTQDARAKELWPTAIADVSRVLRIEH